MILWVDQNLPPALAEWLRAKGHDAQHVQELGLDQADDIGIATNAMAAGATIISKDDDFAFKEPPPTVLVRIGNVTNPKRIRMAVAPLRRVHGASAKCTNSPTHRCISALGLHAPYLATRASLRSSRREAVGSRFSIPDLSA